MKKRLILQINDEIKETLIREKTEKWLIKNIPKFDSTLVLRPQKYQSKSLFRPRVSPEVFYDLQEIPGNSNTQKVVNLFYNIKRQKEKQQNREKILKELFPNNSYNRR